MPEASGHRALLGSPRYGELLALAANLLVVVAITIAIRATGGLPSQLAHLYFIPILAAALFLPARYAFFVVAAAVLGVSPAMNVVADLTGGPQHIPNAMPWTLSSDGWVVRPIAFVTISIIAHALTRELTKRHQVEAALGQSDERLQVLYEEALGAKQQLEHALEVERDRSRRDPLTNKLNHGAILQELECLVAAADGEPLAIAVADVDNLKAINDTYGHQMGDAALIATATALSTKDAIVGRYGGDEFVAVLPGTDREGAEAYREAARLALQRANLTDPDVDTIVPVVASIGLAAYPDEAETGEDLIRLADNAMYVERGRGDGTRSPDLLLDSERATKLISEIVPLLTTRGSRADKLRLVSQHLSVGAGYDAVNIEVTGAPPDEHTEWERTFGRMSPELIQAWQREQSAAKEHPLGQLLARTRRPVFLDDLQNDERLTDTERDIIKAAGLRSAVVVPMIWQDQLVGMLSVCRKRKAAFRAWDAHFISAVARHVTAIVFMADLVDELQVASADLREAQGETVLLLAAAAEAYDHGTGRHLQRVRATSGAIARELGYSELESQAISLAAVLHDVGKIRVPHAVLQSPRKLTEDEWAEMQQHTVWGGEFLSGRKGFELAAAVARSHHERWDGAGYPQGLAGDEIPEAAAIASVADSFDAITSDRPYRAGRPAAEAISEIVACSGKQFSPRVVDALVRLYERRELPFIGETKLETRAAA
jgi:diguanylate cyclase (GGDEF)-like protein